MSQKSDYLEAVTSAARNYHRAKENAEDCRMLLARAIYFAYEVKATQQQIADSTAFEEGEGISRQRVAQIIKEDYETS